jgi:hypothetical protein
MGERMIMWPGSSGKKYKYLIYHINTLFEDLPGNYIFAKETSIGRWIPIYIGETDSLHDRLSNHEKMPCIKHHGGTHVHIHTSSVDEESRRAEESELIANWNPPCNRE